MTRKSSSSTAAAAAVAKPKPKAFSFKSISRDKPSKNSATSSSSTSGDARTSKPTTARVHECVIQSGDRAGDKSDNFIYVFNPRFGLNDEAKEAVQVHAYPGDTVGSFKKDLGGFTVRVHNPSQAQRMHAALRVLDESMDADLDMASLKAPEVKLVRVSNIDLPETKYHDRREGVTVIMLEGYTYPLYKILRKDGHCDFVRAVHDKPGVNKWVRVLSKTEESDPSGEVHKELAGILEAGT